QRERDALFTETSRYMDDPHYMVPKAVNADDEGRKAILKAGWDIRSGMMYRQTSLGEMAFVPEEVMFGPIPTDDPVSAKHFQQTRASFQPEYRTAFMRYVKARGDRTVLTGAEQNALSEGIA